MPDISGWCEKDHCSTIVLAERTSGDVHLRICQCPICNAKKVEKWRLVRSFVTSLKTKDPESLLQIEENI